MSSGESVNATRRYKSCICRRRLSVEVRFEAGEALADGVARERAAAICVRDLETGLGQCEILV